MLVIDEFPITVTGKLRKVEMARVRPTVGDGPLNDARITKQVTKANRVRPLSGLPDPQDARALKRDVQFCRIERMCEVTTREFLDATRAVADGVSVQVEVLSRG